MQQGKQEGNISEWNEASFKSMRLHYAQSIINYAKLSPLDQSQMGKGFNYNLWITNIDILYDEGKSKYSKYNSWIPSSYHYILVNSHRFKNHLSEIEVWERKS